MRYAAGTRRGDRIRVMPAEPGSQKFSAKIPLQLRCDKCKEPFTLKIHLNQTSFDWTCPKCGFVHVSFLGLDVTIGYLLREKSRHELLQEKDYPMAIVFAAWRLSLSCRVCLASGKRLSASCLVGFLIARNVNVSCEASLQSTER